MSEPTPLHHHCGHKIRLKKICPIHGEVADLGDVYGPDEVSRLKAENDDALDLLRGLLDPNMPCNLKGAVDYMIDHSNEGWMRVSAFTTENAALKADNERLTAELALWKPMTPAEAQAAYDAAEAVPVSEEEIERMVAFATDPANRLNNEEEAQLHVRYRKVCAANADLRATVAAREATIAEMREAIEEYSIYAQASGSAPFGATEKEKAALADAGSSLLARLRSAEACAKMLDAQRKCNQLGTDTDELVDTWLKLTEVSSDERH